MKQHQLSSEVESKIAGPQGSISSRTTINDWLAKNREGFNFAFGQPTAFGCTICQALRFDTLEEATQHTKTENKTIRSRYWTHDVTVVCKKIVGYEISVEDIIKEAKRQETE